MTAFLLLEGFDYWANIGSGHGKIDGTNGWTCASCNLGSGRFGGQSLGYNGGYAFSLNLQLPAFDVKWTYGHAVMQDAWSGWYSTGNWLSWCSNGTTLCTLVAVNSPTGGGTGAQFQFVDSGGGTTQLTTPLANPGNSHWTYLEACVVAGTTSATGSFILRQDGVTLLSVGVPTTTAANPQINQINFRSCGSGGSVNVIDDIYVYNGQPIPSVSGTRSFIGPLFVETLRPNADISNTGTWTPSSGTALYDMIDDTTVDGTATYLGVSTNAATALFSVGSLTGTIGTILGIQPVISAVGAASTMAAEIISNGQTATTAYENLTGVTYTAISAGVIYLDPNTNANWTQSSINAGTYGLVKGSP